MSIRTTMPSEPAPGEADYGQSEALSLIDRHSTFDGSFRSDRDLRIEGDVKGTVVCQGLLFIAQGATVNANIEAENVTVAGDLEGEINCRGRLQLLPSCRMRGKVTTASLVINEGAYYEGQLEMAAPDDRGRSNRGATGGSNPVPITAAAENRSATTFIRRLGGPETAWEGKQDESNAETADSGDDKG